MGDRMTFRGPKNEGEIFVPLISLVKGSEEAGTSSVAIVAATAMALQLKIHNPFRRDVN